MYRKNCNLLAFILLRPSSFPQQFLIFHHHSFLSFLKYFRFHLIFIRLHVYSASSASCILLIPYLQLLFHDSLGLYVIFIPPFIPIYSSNSWIWSVFIFILSFMSLILRNSLFLLPSRVFRKCYIMRSVHPVYIDS